MCVDSSRCVLIPRDVDVLAVLMPDSARAATVDSMDLAELIRKNDRKIPACMEGTPPS